MMVNPYESFPNATLPPERVAPRLLDLLAWFYPGLLILSLYGTWLMAWLTLGHMPRPSLDDPKRIGLGVDIAYLLAGLLLIGFPAAALLGVASQFFGTHRSWTKRILLGILLALTWVIVIMFLRWDPLLVGTWYMD